MGERKVLNKYFPPDFDPSKVPKSKGGFDPDAAQTIRMMTPFSMVCETCGHYMRSGKKFNCKKERAKGMDYLKIKRVRFLIKCEICKAPITFLTDPKNQDYEMESGGRRLYDPKKEAAESEAAAQEQAVTEVKDSMKTLENRTLDSKMEMEVLDALDDIKSQNRNRERLGAESVDQVLNYGQDDDDEKNDQADARATEEAFLKKRSIVKRIDTSEASLSVDKPDIKLNDSEPCAPRVVLKKRKRDKKKAKPDVAKKAKGLATGGLVSYGLDDSSDEE
mmetsp:Transcript_27866/g.44637  ORF Transcript_27866/g.44637 Transcript_27866/m.44637 type:complete len:277 (-) Transcript_27866:4253-5083(-)